MFQGKKLVKPVTSSRKGSIKEGESTHQEYKKKYREIEQIGRGTSGTAYLVKQKLDRKFYIAKKIILTNLDTKEREAVEQELLLLKKLQHPHVVRYIESFQDASYLVIVMEYCEQGDLSFHIRQKQKEGGLFSEKVIMNWFIQLTMAIDFVHNNHVLHRDIKCSNVFLTSNGSIKLGDFGVSKVLRSTTDNAQTLIGTPYYLSPEVCENKPYTFQSDIWALGCVLFEICSLRHPFSCDNLIQLVVKIINEPNPKIPSSYSEELQCLVQILLAKRPEQRPVTKQIFSFPFIVDTMKDFVSSKGLKSELKNLPIKKTQLHLEKEKKRMEDKNVKQNQLIVAGKGAKNTATPIIANKKVPVQASPKVEQTKQSITPNNKPQRKNSKDIRRMEDLIQKQMSEVKSDVQKKMSEVRASKKPVTQPVSQPEKHIQQKSNSNIEAKPIVKQKVSGEASPAVQQTKLAQKQQISAPKNDKAITPQQSNYNKKIEEMMNNLQSKVKQEYELIKKESPKKSQIKNQTKDSPVINLEKSRDTPIQGQPLKEKVEELANFATSGKQFQSKAGSSMMQDSNVSFNLSLTNDSVFNQTAFKKGINMKLGISQPKMPNINEEISQEIQDPTQQGETEEELKEEIDEKNEFIEDNNKDDAIKYQTAISECIQTQQLTAKETQLAEQINQKQEDCVKNNNEDSFDIESLPQREDYIDSDEDEQYQEDFNVSSEEGEQDSAGSEKPSDFRLTRKNMEKELEEVLDMYKSQLGTSAPQEFDKFKNMLNMSEIAEVSVEYSTGELSKKLGNYNGQLSTLKQS